MQIAILSRGLEQIIPDYTIFAGGAMVALSAVDPPSGSSVTFTWSYVDQAQEVHTIESPQNFTIPLHDYMPTQSNPPPALASVRITASTAAPTQSSVSVPIYVAPAGTQRDDILLVYGTNGLLYLYFQPTSPAQAPRGPYLIPQVPTLIPPTDIGPAGPIASNLTSDGAAWITCALVNLASSQIQPG